MKEHPIIFSTDMVKAILDGRKTQTRRVVTKQNSVIGEGGNWSLLDFNAQTFLRDDLIPLFALGAEKGSIADIVVKNNGRAPLPWIDNSVSPQYGVNYTWLYLHVPYNWTNNGTIYRVYPKWKVGDRLWVKEAFCDACYQKDGVEDACYKEDFYRHGDTQCEFKTKWRPSIHMTRWASRIDLEITGVRVERVKEINGKDAQKEGWNRDGELFPLMNTDDKAISWFTKLWDSINAKRGYSWESNPWVWVIRFKLVELLETGRMG